MTLQFVNGGARGLNQSIQYLRFKTSTLPFVISCFNSGSCSTTSSRPVSYYRSTNDPWNISFNISNATLQDTDTYYVEAGVINPSITNEIQTITSTVSINIISKTGTCTLLVIQFPYLINYAFCFACLTMLFLYFVLDSNILL